MNVISEIFNIILYRPLFNALILLYQLVPGNDFGVSVILLTIFIRIILYPLMTQSIKSQKVLSELQPKIQEIQKRYKNDQERQAKEILQLYQKEKINPFSSLFPILIQLPILIALYQVFWKGFQPAEMVNLYSFVPKPEVINPFFLGIINLSQKNLIFAFLAGFAQFFQSKIMMGKSRKEKGSTAQFSDVFQKQMLYFVPIFTFIILMRLPSAISLYLVVTTLFSIIQQQFIF